MYSFYGTWPWYISGFLIGAVMLLLIYFGKTFGMSSNLRSMCSILGAGRTAEFFRFDWKAQRWNFILKRWLRCKSESTNRYRTSSDEY
jgi:hypothetical protein